MGKGCRRLRRAVEHVARQVDERGHDRVIAVLGERDHAEVHARAHALVQLARIGLRQAGPRRLVHGDRECSYFLLNISLQLK